MSRLTLLYSRYQIAARVQQLADTVNRDYGQTALIAVGVLKGGSIFLADLVRRLDMPVRVDFIAISSYGCGTQSSRHVRVSSDLGSSVEGKHVLLVDDIIDTGFSAQFLFRYLADRKPTSCKTCFLIDKSTRRQVEFRPDYVGFALGGGFVVGYGMDYAESYRNLADIYRLD